MGNFKQFVHPLVATPKETWNGSKDNWRIAEVLNYFMIEILICLKNKTNTKDSS